MRNGVFESVIRAEVGSVVSLNSSGCGSVFEFIAAARLVAEKRLGIEVVGMAHGAALYLLAAAVSVKMSDGAVLGFTRHRVETSATSARLSSTAELLGRLDSYLAERLSRVSTLSTDEVLDLMDRESFVEAKGAAELGFIFGDRLEEG